jgi:hypothetical protein
MFTYKLVNAPFSKSPNSVLRSDGVGIPFDPQNSDYQQYLKDVENGVEVLSADE